MFIITSPLGVLTKKKIDMMQKVGVLMSYEVWVIWVITRILAIDMTHDAGLGLC